eukprot:2664425-Pleurochrysis_carterae.AAC.1
MPRRGLASREGQEERARAQALEKWGNGVLNVILCKVWTGEGVVSWQRLCFGSRDMEFRLSGRYIIALGRRR